MKPYSTRHLLVKHSADKWLSQVLDRYCYTIKLDEEGQPLAEVLSQLNASPCFLTCKVNDEDVSLSAALSNIGFIPVETSLLFRLALDEHATPMQGTNVRQALPDDLEAVAEIAGRAFTCSRFHRDPMISNEFADRVKREWAANFFSGERGDYMLIAEAQGRVAGFMQLIVNQSNELVIDLIAVSPEYARQSLASRMLGYAINQLAGKCNASVILAGTQATNLKSVNFYIRNGFKLQATSCVFHYHQAA